MRFLSFKTGDSSSWGMINSNGVIDLGGRMGCDFKQALVNDRLDEAKTLAAGLTPDIATADTANIHAAGLTDQQSKRQCTTQVSCDDPQ